MSFVDKLWLSPNWLTPVTDLTSLSWLSPKWLVSDLVCHRFDWHAYNRPSYCWVLWIYARRRRNTWRRLYARPSAGAHCRCLRHWSVWPSSLCCVRNQSLTQDALLTLTLIVVGETGVIRNTGQYETRDFRYLFIIFFQMAGYHRIPICKYWH